jgi:hypothetical protein
MGKENKNPTFIDQAFAIIEEHYANEDPKAPHGMTISDHKLNCKVLDAHEGYIEGLIDERILRTLQSDELANKVAEKVRADVAETYIQLAASLKNIEASIDSINNKLAEDEKIIKLEVERLDLRIDKKRDAIKELRDDYEKNKDHLEYVARVRPTLETIQKVFTFWSWKKNWLKIISIIIGIILLFSSVVIGIYSFMRKSGWLSQGNTSGIEKILTDIKTGNISPETRSIHYDRLTLTQQDYIIDQNEKAILNTIK